MKTCKTCKHWRSDDRGEFDPPPHKDFNFCSGIKIHEGEMYDAKHETDIPLEDADMVINTSEWFQDFQAHKNFGCNKYETPY